MASKPIPPYLPSILRAWSLFALSMGTCGTLTGLDMINIYGLPSPSITTPGDIMADSNFRYFGAQWACWGAMLYWTAGDLKARKAPLAILWGFLAFGGVGRTIGVLRHGAGSMFPGIAIICEFMFPVMVWAAMR